MNDAWYLFSLSGHLLRRRHLLHLALPLQHGQLGVLAVGGALLKMEKKSIQVSGDWASQDIDTLDTYDTDGSVRSYLVKYPSIVFTGKVLLYIPVLPYNPKRFRICAPPVSPHLSFFFFFLQKNMYL